MGKFLTPSESHCPECGSAFDEGYCPVCDWNPSRIKKGWN